MNVKKKTFCQSKFQCVQYHCEAGEGYWLQGEAALQAHSFRDADPHAVISKKLSGWNGLEMAINDRICLENSGYGRKCI